MIQTIIIKVSTINSYSAPYRRLNEESISLQWTRQKYIVTIETSRQIKFKVKSSWKEKSLSLILKLKWASNREWERLIEEFRVLQSRVEGSGVRCTRVRHSQPGTCTATFSRCYRRWMNFVTWESSSLCLCSRFYLYCEFCNLYIMDVSIWFTWIIFFVKCVHRKKCNKRN